MTKNLRTGSPTEKQNPTWQKYSFWLHFPAMEKTSLWLQKQPLEDNSRENPHYFVSFSMAIRPAPHYSETQHSMQKYAASVLEGLNCSRSLRAIQKEPQGNVL